MHPQQDYLNFLAQGRFMIQRCRDSGRYIFYPRVAEPLTGSTNLEWVEPSGRGTVYSTTVVGQKPPAENYNVCLVDLEEGPRMMGRVDGVPPEQVKIGMKVKARVLVQGGQGMVVFDPVA